MGSLKVRSFDSLDRLGERSDRGEIVSAETIIAAFERCALSPEPVFRPSSVARLVNSAPLSHGQLEYVAKLCRQAAHQAFVITGGSLSQLAYSSHRFFHTLLFHELAARAERMAKVATERDLSLIQTQ